MKEVNSCDYNLVALLKAVVKSPNGVQRLYEDPLSTARSFGFELAPDLSEALKDLDMSSKLSEVNVSIDQEVADFFHATIVDGRYVEEWASDPTDVASRLGIIVSEPAIQRVTEIQNSFNFNAMAKLRPEAAWVGIVIRVAIAVVVATGPKGKNLQSPVFQPAHIDRL